MGSSCRWKDRIVGLVRPDKSGEVAEWLMAHAWPPPVGGVPPAGGKRQKMNMENYIVYIIYSEKTGKYYVGVTSNLAQRLRQHNSGANRSTKNKGPWAVIYTEQFLNTTDAWKREKQIKSYKGGKAFKKLLEKKLNGEFA